MSDQSPDTTDDLIENVSAETSALAATPITSPYKVLGELTANSGVGVLGQNNAGSGTPIGVQGAVPNNPDGYGLATPDDARIDGDIEATSEHRLTVNGDRTLRLGPTATRTPFSGSSYTVGGNVVGGYEGNTANNAVGATICGGGNGDDNRTNEVTDDYGVVVGGTANQAGDAQSGTDSASYATVGGGTFNTAEGVRSAVLGGSGNTASGGRSFVGGGSGNIASSARAAVGGGNSNKATGRDTAIGGGNQNTATDSEAVVGGGFLNEANGYASAIGGGSSNRAGISGTDTGTYATVPGGTDNVAEADRSFAAGDHAKAADAKSFVWNDGSEYHDLDSSVGADGLSSSKDIASSGVTGNQTFHVSAQGGFRFITGSSSVTYISGGSTGWSTASSRTVKTNIDPVDTRDVLDGVESMNLNTWEYEDDDGDGAGVRHMGPMAEDFHEAFDLGDSDEHINSVNADGVALAAIQGLAERLEAKTARIETLEAENEQLRERMETETGDLRDRIAALEDQVARVESDASGSSAPADD